MLKIINSKQSKELDKTTISKKVSSKDDLIDSAGKAIAYHIIESIDHPFSARILCIGGNGDNGMDAIVANKYLNRNNINSDLLIIDPKSITSTHLLDVSYFTTTDSLNFFDYDYLVDGIFGTGLNRDVAGIFSSTIERMQSHKNIISIDIPSGIYADSGNTSSRFVNAKDTVTFTYPKLGHYLSDGYRARGDLSIYPIGHSLDEVSCEAHLIEDRDIVKILKPIDSTSDNILMVKFFL